MDTVIERKGFGWGYLIVGILFILVSLVAFRNPVGDLFAIAIIFGGMAIVNGVWLVTQRHGSTTILLVGILEILIGLLLLFNLGVTAQAIAYVFAIWFILNSVSNLFLLKYFKSLGNGYYWLMLILNVLGIIAGVAMLFEPLISVITLAFIVGFYFMLIGVANLILAFSNPTIRISVDEEKRED